MGHELRDRMVECGSCEHRFRILDEVVVHHRKFYPGERKDAKLEAFQRLPMATIYTSGGGPEEFMHETANIKLFGPTPFYRTLVGIVGAAVMLFAGLLLTLGAHRGAALDGMSMANRMILAGFLAFLGSWFLLFANPRGRGKAVLIVALCSAAIISLPWFFRDASAPLQAVGRAPDTLAMPEPGPKPVSSMDKLRELIGDHPLVAEIKRAEQEKPGSGRNVAGLWLRGLEEQYKLQVRDYIIRSTGADSSSHLYPRGGGDFLMVVSGLRGGIHDLHEAAGRLGRVERVIDELQVVEVVVDNPSFIEGPFDKLTDPKDPSFYSLNKRELDSVDLRRARRAAKRLAEVEPKLFRDDIAKRLVELLKEGDLEILGDVAHALEVWTVPGDQASPAVSEAIAKLKAGGKDVPESMIRFLVRQKDPAVLPVVDDVWMSNPTDWESLYAEVGASGEERLLKHLEDERPVIRKSAARLLGHVGGMERSVPALEKSVAGADTEMKVIIERSLAAIRARETGAKP